MTRLRRSRAAKALAVLTAFALICVGVVGAINTVSATAVESKGKYDGSGGSMKVTTATKQMLQIECFSKIATQIKNLEPNVTRPLWAPKNVTSTPEAFTPPTSDAEAFMQVLGTKKTGSMGTVPADMVNTGQSVKLYKFVLYFKTPVANPRLNLAGTEMTQIGNGVPITSSGLRITFSDAYAGYTGKKTDIVSTNRVSGIDQAPESAYRIEANTILTDTVACDGNGGSCGDNRDARLAAVKAKIPGITRLTTPLRGTVELNTNGVPVDKVTVNVGATFFSAKDGKQDLPIPGLAIAPQFRSEVSAFPRTMGLYGEAMHAMPFVGNDNLHFGKTIVEGNRERYTTVLNSGTPTDNSDAGYDGLGTFYWEGDKTKTPVTTVTSKDKGKWLMMDLSVSSKRTDKTAYVYGFIDWAGLGDFAKVDKAKSTLGCVSKGNGKVTIKWKVPDKVTSHPLNMRLRTSYDCCEIDKPTGSALSGEVEDWPGVINGTKNNLKVTKDVTAGATARPGDQVTYTITVKSLDGVATPSAVTVTDSLPSQLRDLSITAPATAGTATLAGNTLTWQLPAGITADQTVRVSGRVADGTPTGDVTNTAKLSALCDPANCEATASFTVPKDATGALQLTKQVESQTTTPVRTNTRIAYVVTMAYTGTVALNDFTFTDDRIPDAADWTCNTPIPTTVNPGYSNVCRATYTVTEQDVRDGWASGFVTNTAEVAGTLAAAPGTRVTQSATAQAALDKTTPRVAITGSKTVSPLAVVPGQPATYTITATNDGQLTATNVHVLDSLEGAAPAAIDPANCTWDGVPGELAPGDTVTCTTTYTPTQADAGKTLHNAATATATDGTEAYGPVPLGEADLTVNAASLSIVKSNSLDGTAPMVRPGDTFTYTIRVTNNGTATANDVRVVDVLPEGLTLEPADQPGWTVNPANPRQITSDPFSLDPERSQTLTLTVLVGDDATGELINMSFIESFTSMATCMSNAKAAGCAADDNPPVVAKDPIVIEKKSDVAPGETVSIGRVITYTLTVTNKTGQDASDVVVIDQLPNELAPYPTDQPGWTISGQRLTSDPFDLANGETKTLTLTSSAQVASTDLVRNWVVVAGYTLDASSALARSVVPTGLAVAPMTVNDCLQSGSDPRCAHADIPAIQGRSGVNVTVQSTAPEQVKAGDTFEYMILALNTSNKDATGVSITHALPEGLEFTGNQDYLWKVSGRTASLTTTIKAQTAVAYWLRVKVVDGASGPLQAFTLLDGALLTDCQANIKAPGCAPDPRAPIAG